MCGSVGLGLIFYLIWILMLRIDSNVRLGFKWAQVIFMDTNVDDGFMNWIQVGFDCWTNLNTNVKDGYEFVRVGFKWAKVIFINTNVNDGFMNGIQV